MEAKDDPDGTRPRGPGAHAFRAARGDGAGARLRAPRALAHGAAPAIPQGARDTRDAVMQAIEETTAPVAAPSPRRSPWSALSSPSFLKLWVASTLSLFGYFFSYIAMAWLVLQLTGSGVALGTVLVLQSLPRAVLMVVGGAMADRLSPRVTMLASMGLRTLFVAPFALLIVSHHAQMWETYVVALAMGVGDAFFMPARTAILPSIVAGSELEASNAVMNVSGQGALVLGPVLSGLVVTAWGTGWAFAGDALCFAVGFVFVMLLPGAGSAAAGKPHPHGGLAGQIVAGPGAAGGHDGNRRPFN